MEELVSSFEGWIMEKRNIEESKRSKGGYFINSGHSHSGNRKERTDPSCVLGSESTRLPLGSMFS